MLKVYYYKNNFHKKFKYCVLVFLCVIIFIVTSCKIIKNEASYITITDMLGDSITIQKNPKKVACVSRTTYDLLVAFGLSDKIDGAYKNLYSNPWLEVIYPDSKNEYRYEYEENYETFLERKVDLVFAPEKYISDNLKSHGINSLCISLYGNPSFDDYVFFFADTVMKLWDDEEVHKKVLKWKKDVNKAIEECCVDNSTEVSKKLYYVRGDKNKGIEYTDTKGSFTEYIFRKFGYDFAGNTFNNTKPSKEEICRFDPYIFVIGGIFQNTLKYKLLNDDIYKNLEAVKNNRVYTIPVGLTSFEQLSITTPVFIYYMSNILNNTDYDIVNMIKDTFIEYFDKDLNNQQIEYMIYGKDPNGNDINNE